METDGARVFSDSIDRLLNTLEVHFHDCTVCTVPPGTRVRFDPVDAITVQYILAGKGSLLAGDGVIQFGPQNVVIAPPRVSHSWGSDSNLVDELSGPSHCEPINDHQAGLVSKADSDPHIRIIRSEITVTNAGVPGFFDHLQAAIFEDLAGSDEARRIFALLLTERARPGAGSQAVAEGLMKAFLILSLRQHLHRSEASTSSFKMVSDPQLARAMINILERPADAHTVDTLATAAGMSRTAFLDRFRKAFSQTPIEFVQEFRLKFAAHLLRTTTLPIKSIAVTVGYSSRSYFSRAFRASYALDPSAYREANRTRSSIATGSGAGENPST